MQTGKKMNEAMQEVITTYGLDPLENGKLYAFISDCGYIADTPSIKECISSLSSSGTARELYDLKGSSEPIRLGNIIINNFAKAHAGMDVENIRTVAMAIFYAAGIQTEETQTVGIIDKKKLTPWHWVFAALIAAGAIYGTVATLRYTFPKEQEDVVLPSEIAKQIEGFYSIRLTNNGSTSILTGEVTKLTVDSYTLYVVTEYGPEYITFSIDRNLNVTSDQLGDGKLKYRRELNKTTIPFKKSGSVCELSK